LRATVQDVAGRARGTAILAHAEFTSHDEFLRSGGLAHGLASRGWRTIAFDFRGHGESRSRTGEGRDDVTYDDLLRHDLATVADCARARWSGRLVVVGHALGGHVAMAGCGTSVVDIDAIVAIAANVWLPQFDPSPLRWRAKRAAIELISAVVRARGHFPARAMGLGSEDESAALIQSAVRAAREGVWRSEDGTLDYERALERVRVPILALASATGRLRCAPECAERMLARCAGAKDFRLIAHDDRGGPAPGYMGLVRGPRASNVWETAADWMDEL